jgi:hypothetical protein
MAASTNPWLLLLLVLLALNFARIVSESLILDHQSLEDDEFDPIGKFIFSYVIMYSILLYFLLR